MGKVRVDPESEEEALNNPGDRQQRFKPSGSRGEGEVSGFKVFYGKIYRA